MFIQPFLLIWDRLFLADANPLSLLLCLCLLVFVLWPHPLNVCDLWVCTCMIYTCVMHECISPCVCMCRVPLVSPVCLCVHICVPVCHSHPSRAVHLYLSETSIEIDSSDGMISDPSTGDSSSSEEEGPSSGDDDGGDDSDWGGDADAEPTRKFDEGMPVGTCGPRHRAQRGLDEESAAAEGEMCTLYKYVRETESLKTFQTSTRG